MNHLQKIPPRSNASCCGTCQHWVLSGQIPVCPKTQDPLESDLTSCRCDDWKLEDIESFSRHLYISLGGTLDF